MPNALEVYIDDNFPEEDYFTDEDRQRIYTVAFYDLQELGWKKNDKSPENFQKIVDYFRENRNLFTPYNLHSSSNESNESSSSSSDFGNVIDKTITDNYERVVAIDTVLKDELIGDGDAYIDPSYANILRTFLTHLNVNRDDRFRVSFALSCYHYFSYVFSKSNRHLILSKISDIYKSLYHTNFYDFMSDETLNQIIDDFTPDLYPQGSEEKYFFLLSLLTLLLPNLEYRPLYEVLRRQR